MPRPAPVSDADLRTALVAAEGIARRLAPTQALAELANDKAIDAILRAIRTYDPRRGSFPAYARSFSYLAVTAALRKPMPRTRRRLGEAEPNESVASTAPSGSGDGPAYERLPQSLRTAAILRFCHGYSAADTALLCGIDRVTLRSRLAEAAALIDP